MGKESNDHPLHQIAESLTHKLLLKQWLKEEELLSHRISHREAHLQSLHSDISSLFCFFFLFHAFFILSLFLSHSDNSLSSKCDSAWIPSLVSLSCSLVMAWAVKYKAEEERREEKILEREEEDGRLLGRCVEELKRKGLEFDLLKEVDALRRAKSLRVEAALVNGREKGWMRRWSKSDSTALFFVAASAAALVLIRVVLCN